MIINLKTKEQKEITRQCLEMALDEKFFPNQEFQTLIGFSKKDLEKIILNWKNTNFHDQNIQEIINNIFINLLGYPHGQDKYLEESLGISRDPLEEIFNQI